MCRTILHCLSLLSCCPAAEEQLTVLHAVYVDQVFSAITYLVCCFGFVLQKRGWLKPSSTQSPVITPPIGHLFEPEKIVFTGSVACAAALHSRDIDKLDPDSHAAWVLNDKDALALMKAFANLANAISAKDGTPVVSRYDLCAPAC